MALELVLPWPLDETQGPVAMLGCPGVFGTRSRTKLYLKCRYHVPTDGTRAANMGTGDFGTSPIFGQLSDKPLLASIYSLGVSERKAQWRIETLKPMTKRFL